VIGRYCIADDSLVNAIEFLDLGDGAGWELLQVYTICLSEWLLFASLQRTKNITNDRKPGDG
jgi:hypothetical protein